MFKRGGELTLSTMADSGSEPTVPIVCEDCGTETDIRLSELADTLERHNDNRHDGEEVAQVDPTVADELANLVAKDLDLL